jgi:Prohead core protein serine protease
MVQILQEHLHFDTANMQLISESAGEGGKKLYMEGIFIQGGIKNHNGRVYPVSEIRKAVDIINESIQRDAGVPGELDHPQELQIHLDRVSHQIIKMWMDGPNGMGKLRLLPTPCGQIAQTLLESGVKLGVSSRGSGNVDHTGNVSEFDMLTVDIVAKPSAPSAYPVPMYEAMYHRRFGSNIRDLVESVKHDASAQKHLTRTLLRWVDELK